MSLDIHIAIPSWQVERLDLLGEVFRCSREDVIRLALQDGTSNLMLAAIAVTQGGGPKTLEQMVHYTDFLSRILWNWLEDEKRTS